MLKLFRWQGGYGGDTLLSSILSVNDDLVTNINSIEIQDNGRTFTTYNTEHILCELGYANISSEIALIEQRIEKTINDSKTHIIKNHCYMPFMDKYSEYMVDIVSTNDLLSFTTSANFYKNYEYTSKFLRDSDKFYKILEQNDKYEAENYMLYKIAVSHFNHNAKQHQSKNKIVLDKWIDRRYTDILGYEYSRDILDQWIEKNQFILDRSNLKIEKICDLVKQQVPYNEIRKQLV